MNRVLAKLNQHQMKSDHSSEGCSNSSKQTSLSDINYCVLLQFSVKPQIKQSKISPYLLRIKTCIKIQLTYDEFNVLFYYIIIQYIFY